MDSEAARPTAYQRTVQLCLEFIDSPYRRLTALANLYSAFIVGSGLRGLSMPIGIKCRLAKQGSIQRCRESKFPGDRSRFSVP